MTDPRSAVGTIVEDQSRDVPRWAERLIEASTIMAWASLALILAGVVFASVPVRNPKVQDCGAPIVFVLTGRVDAFVDPTHPPHGMTAKEATAANARPCRKRAAPRVLHGSELLLGGLVLGLGGVAMLLIGRSARRRALLHSFPAPPVPASG
ncbi:MAG: hypothetical protein M3Z46_06180 [Actinomycetota bacterium]|nr:hypothetical protein [Actinomycetota bacterium]